MKREGYQPTQYPNGAVCNSSIAGCTPGVGTDAETGQAAVALMTFAAGVTAVPVGSSIAGRYIAGRAMDLVNTLGEISMNPAAALATGIAINDRVRAGLFGDRIIQTGQSIASNIARNPDVPSRIRHAAQNVLDMLTR